MKRLFRTGKFVSILVAAIFSTNSYAQESDLTFKRFGGGGWTAVFDMSGGYGLGGYGEIAFLLNNKGGLQIVNHIIGKGENIVVDGNAYGVGSITEKISFGGFLGSPVKPCVYPQIFATLNKKNFISATPLSEALNALIFALKDSAEAFVDRFTKKFNISS